VESDASRFELLAKVGDLAVARIVAARLEAAGLEVRIHSEAFGPYPVTVGRMAEAQLWVPSDRLEEARRVMLEADVDAAFPAEESPETWSWEARLAAFLLLAVLIALVVARAWRVF
jgi:hypothetical protein